MLSYENFANKTLPHTYRGSHCTKEGIYMSIVCAQATDVRHRYHLDFTRRNDFVVARLAPQTEHLPSTVIFGCSFTSVSQSPHFGIKSPPLKAYQQSVNVLANKSYATCARPFFLALPKLDILTVALNDVLLRRFSTRAKCGRLIDFDTTYSLTLS
jgi:hypothetical protein